MYLVDFFKSTARKSNIPQFIYLGLNVVIICLIMAAFFSGGTGKGIFLSILFGIALYAVSLAIALSPFGERITRYQTGCKEITDADINNYLMPIFNEVYQKAKAKNPTISPDVKLYMSDDEFKNAFATGRQTICITRGIATIEPEQLKGVLAHEFGHLAHKDTDMLQVINVGNTIITAIIVFFRVMVVVMDGFMKLVGGIIGGDEGAFVSLLSGVGRIFSLIFVAGLSKLWSWIGVILCMKTSRGNEFEADAFSTELGYGSSLIQFFNENVGNNPTGLFATLAASHPDKDDRVANILKVSESMAAAENALPDAQSGIAQAPAVPAENPFDKGKAAAQAGLDKVKGGFQKLKMPDAAAAFTDKFTQKKDKK